MAFFFFGPIQIKANFNYRMFNALKTKQCEKVNDFKTYLYNIAKVSCLNNTNVTPV